LAKLNILFVVPYPEGEAPSQRFRFEQYYPLLKNHDYSIKLSPFLSVKSWSKIYNPKTRLIDLTLAIAFGFIKRIWLLIFCYSYQYIFIHREAAPIGPPVFEWIITKIFNKKVIYDFDDAIWLKDNIYEHRFFTFLKNRKKVKRIIKWSYKISCGNEFLASFSNTIQSNVVINPSTIDTGYHINPSNRKNQEDNLIIGWTGSHTTLKYIDLIVSVLRELEKNT